MRKLFLLLIMFTTCQYVYNQVIKGTVFDSETRKIISYASIYFNGTFVGTTTDPYGNFELDVTKNKPMPLTVSAIGYYSITTADYITGQSIKIYMTPKIYELTEVSVRAKSLARERRENLIIFREEFLGTTENATKCKINNENDITFNYNSDKDTLKAFASKPLHIINMGLGYKITYYLDKFEYYRNSKTFKFKGDIIFNEDLAKDQEQKRNFEKRRRFAYLGSRMHFFRTLWLNDLKSTGFTIKNTSSKYLYYNDVVLLDANHRKLLSYPEKLTVTYYSNRPPSTIIFLKKLVYFDATGYCDMSGLDWEGEMARQRVGDALPFEYIYKQ